MAIYDLNRSRLDGLLAFEGTDPSVRKSIIDYLTDDGLLHGHNTVHVETSPGDTATQVLLVGSTPASVDTDAYPNLKVIVDTADATLTVTGGSDVFVGTGPGNDTVDMSASTGNDVVMTGRGDDSVTGGQGSDSIYGGNGADTLTAGSNGDGTLLDGGAGNDVLDGNGSSFDTLIGGYGNDLLTAGDGGHQLLLGDGGSVNTDGDHDSDDHGHGHGHDHDHDDHGHGHGQDTGWSSGGGSDTLVGGSGNMDTLNGGGGNDVLIAGTGHDQLLIGGTGNDTFEVGKDGWFKGTDTISGGSGHDKVVFDDTFANAHIDTHHGVTTVTFSDQTGATTTITGVEELKFSDGTDIHLKT